MHARVPLPGGRLVKRFLPRSLLGRSLLMILMPLILLQAVALQIFYGSHLDLVSRRLSAGITNEIAYTLDLMHQFPDAADREWILRDASGRFDLQFTAGPGRDPAEREGGQHPRPDGRRPDGGAEAGFH